MINATKCIELLQYEAPETLSELQEILKDRESCYSPLQKEEDRLAAALERDGYKAGGIHCTRGPVVDSFIQPYAGYYLGEKVQGYVLHMCTRLSSERSRRQETHDAIYFVNAA